MTSLCMFIHMFMSARKRWLHFVSSYVNKKCIYVIWNMPNNFNRLGLKTLFVVVAVALFNNWPLQLLLTSTLNPSYLTLSLKRYADLSTQVESFLCFLKLTNISLQNCPITWNLCIFHYLFPLDRNNTWKMQTESSTFLSYNKYVISIVFTFSKHELFMANIFFILTTYSLLLKYDGHLAKYTKKEMIEINVTKIYEKRICEVWSI